MRTLKFVTSIFLLSFLSAGCAEMEMPGTAEILRDPLGKGTVTVGMTKEQVVLVYGDPDIKQTVTSDAWGGSREEWFYKARYSALPVNAGYLSKDLYLYFDGDSLTNISVDPLGRSSAANDDKTADKFIK
ncbi:MAG: outer membrane protein assembly factor BamE [Candidatus Omnitrophota bacterium]